MKISHPNMYLLLLMVSAIELSAKTDAEAISLPTFAKSFFKRNILDTLVVSVGFSGNNDKPDDLSSNLADILEHIIRKNDYCQGIVERAALDEVLQKIGTENFIEGLSQKESTILQKFKTANAFILCKVSRDKGGREITFSAKAVMLNGVIRSTSIVNIILPKEIPDLDHLSANMKKEILQKLARGLCEKYSLKRTVITGVVVAAVSTTIWYVLFPPSPSPSGSIEIIGSWGP